MRRLFDASGLLNIIRSLGLDSLGILRGNYILTLTLYEVGNALWKEAAQLNRISVDEALSIINSINKVCKVLNIVAPQDNRLVFRVAYELKLTYYDSSYIVGAYELDAELVTDDEKLRKRIVRDRELLLNLLGRRIVIKSTEELISGR